MSARIKQAIVKSVSEAIATANDSRGAAAWIASNLVPSNMNRKSNNSVAVQYDLFLPHERSRDANEIISNIRNKHDIIKEAAASEKIDFKEISPDGKCMKFEVNVKDVIQDVLSVKPTDLSFQPRRETVVVEFSSPNIAKEFHFGHLRSTIIGNALSNVFKKMGKDVIRLNYIGDWGTQFGLLTVGLDRLGYNDESLKDNAIKKLQEAYIHANKLSNRDGEIGKQAREVFQRMESGDEEVLKTWQTLRERTRNDLASMYHRIGVSFDEYDWESNYRKSMADGFLKIFDQQNALGDDELGRKVVDLDGKAVPVLKSDGTSLYLLRDLMAVFKRRDRFNFDKHCYVVDSSQLPHFKNLFGICGKIEPELASKLEHVRFGRVIGMSTRKGTVVSLKDVLDEARERMREKQLSKATTRGPVTDDTADALGASAIIVNDLKRNRVREYEFDWDTALDSDGNSGVQLQYGHCRMRSLLERSGAELPADCDPEALLEPAAIQLVLDVSRYEHALSATERGSDPQQLVKYLFALLRTANSAMFTLNIKKSESHVGNQRLLLFNSARLILGEGLGLLGLKPLEEM